jgi:SAM-dependent methyltransferase
MERDLAPDNVAYYEALADRYNLFFRDFEASMEEEGRWLDGVLSRFGVRRVLDACCGTGRQAIPLVKRGYHVVGADPSPEMLRCGAENAQRHGVQFPMVPARFGDLPAHFGREFDAVIALGNGLCNLQGPGEILCALRSLSACCRPGGVCVLGIKDFDRIRSSRRRFHGHAIVDDAAKRVVLFEIWDFRDPFLLSTAFALEGPNEAAPQKGAWSVRSAQTCEYMLGQDELCDLAARAGFRSWERLDHPIEAAYALLT